MWLKLDTAGAYTMQGKYTRDYSIGIGLHGAETHTYAVQIFSRPAFVRWLEARQNVFQELSYRDIDGTMLRTVKVRVLSQMAFK